MTTNENEILKADVARLQAKLAAEKEYVNELLKSSNHLFVENEQLKANNHDLREALEEIARDSFVDSWQNKLAQKALSATPAESLQAHDDEVIKRWLCKIYPKSEG